jgi:hypothetical protein
MLVDNGLGRGTHIAPNLIETRLNLHYLIERNRGTCIAFNTALALASSKVATELFGKDIRRNQHIAYLENGGNGHEDLERMV